MNTRMKMHEIEPDGYKAMAGFEKYLAGTSLTQRHKDLIKIRASQLNGCSYCVDKHSAEARGAGESERRLYAIPVWRETPFFTPDERMILALTEEVTFIAQRLSDETYNQSVALLGEKYVAQVMFTIIAINAWNRIGVATNMMPS